ncbi:magnesium transporter [Candidatus Kinetoplastibacterium desouzaii TCC079E]|uniref:Magnesium transporter MgtE n=1 Tax=Candidatus Kinetoplastidibacterium desouzai TCC079E TaxID=1208919 RepID=M1LLP0_9PROT|nr:magnesium transporter [Candidatus Kinetoplastibacterium desouzaii]AGF46667.1 magnesium transporter [Candidatus Kinetoplastibacterium desouzaii TCC079E]
MKNNNNEIHKLDPEDAQKALLKIQEYLRNQTPNNEINKQNVINDLTIENNLNNFINDLHPADIAFILESLPKDKRQKIWSIVNEDYKADIIIEVENWVRKSLVEIMEHDNLVSIISKLDADELAYIAQDLPADAISEVQKGLNEEERLKFIEALGYPEESVGAIMDFEMVKVREDITLEVVLRYLRRLQELPDHTDQIFVVDRQDKMQGVLPLTTILVREPETEVKSVMSSDFLTLNPLDSDIDAAGAFERYDLVSAPVIDDSGRLVGRVTIADVVDVIQENSQVQELSRAGLQEEDMFSPLSTAIMNRAPWLLVNLFTASISSFIASRFEDTVSKLVILAFLMSIVAGIGGNSGNQTMTMVIRALATGHITERDLWQLVKREILVASLVGSCGSIVAAIFAWAMSKSIMIALVMMGAIICNVIIGTIIGVLVPILRARFKKDPAIGSSVLLTFATDSLGFLIFLGLATIFLI